MAIMETGRTALSSETAFIKSIVQINGDDNYVVGVRGVTKILAYDEYGEMDWVPWLAVFTGEGKIWKRMPAKTFIVSYQ